MSGLQIWQKNELPKVESQIEGFIHTHTANEQLKESMLYSINAGGKRIRPLLVLATVEAFGQTATQQTYQIAAALEMVHTYSLIHDDLPAMDNDDLRRGKATNHIVFGDALAILAGDALLTGAFELVAETELAADKKNQLLQLLAKSAGANGMVAGQVYDIQSEQKSLTFTELAALHQKKTGALIRFAVVSGGVLTDQDEQVLSKLDDFATHLGLAFQIRDDLLDELATTEQMGKKTKKDDAAGKNTYPVLLGMEKAKSALCAELTQARNILKSLSFNDFNPTLLLEMIKLFELERGNQ
ncbi:polyprenyl synthetase family protein [Tetragenococcus koreensis]|uniref:Farnesyl diphosphate synthase n=1 Tax=Tetragenococcus koreensis TaxID=290335 RepID=A0AAN4UC83_9ENTE|nr:farnesyl diphosphate synthase [Tetragenococcus koreensis]AYW44516.1 polyprenyl synthetase family protein [Tetragenococcus koreensis]MCF1584242.1 polyprenyl synthetase family protein [Tetragenococcus koreensis]MCF1613824.1 polyprenyl synthetase family protein [Tetragenococcus koreensis]MCF1616603.1 polyprenyl synthetase family protein [Tetragenococcus koreensis]MCF1619534.1 polyprenyl synthetase family protein [Tetragenococcus koreensis]